MVKQLHSKIPNLKQIFIIIVNYEKVNMKNKQLKDEQMLNQTCSPGSKSHENFSTMLFASQKFNTLFTCLLPYTYSIIYTKCMGNGIQITVKANELSCVDVASIIVLWYMCYKLVKVASQNSCGMGSFYGSNIFILKSQTG